MTRALPPLLALLAACCGGPGLRVLLTDEHARALKLHMSGPVAADADGNVFLLRNANIARLDPSTHRIEELLHEPTPLAAVAVVPDGTLLVLAGRRLEAVAAGKKLPIAELPGEGLLLAARRDAAYVAAAVGGDVDVFLYRFAERRLEPLFRTAARPHSIAAVAGGCLVALGSGVHKVFDPAGGEVQRRLLFATSARSLAGLAADESSGTIYFSDGEAAYAWRQGRIWPVLAAGGALAVGAGRLVVADARHGQVVDLPLPAPPAVEERLEAVGTPTRWRTDADVLNRRAEWQSDGSLALSFTLHNPSAVWLDRVELSLRLNASDGSALYETTLVRPALVPPYARIPQRIDVPSSLIRDRGLLREHTTAGFRASRAREARVDGGALRLVLKPTRWADDRIVAEVEVVNTGDRPVQVLSLAVSVTDREHRLLKQPSLRSWNQRVEPGETRSAELTLMSRSEWSALEKRGVRDWLFTLGFGSVEPAD